MSADDRQRFTIYGAFLALGIVGGMSLVGYSELKLHFDIDAAQLGALLTTAGLVSLPAQFYAGALIHRFGERLFVAVCVLRAVMTATLVVATAG